MLKSKYLVPINLSKRPSFLDNILRNLLFPSKYYEERFDYVKEKALEDSAKFPSKIKDFIFSQLPDKTFTSLEIISVTNFHQGLFEEIQEIIGSIRTFPNYVWDHELSTLYILFAECERGEKLLLFVDDNFSLTDWTLSSHFTVENRPVLDPEAQPVMILPERQNHC